MTQESAGAEAVLGAAAGLAGGAMAGAVSALKAANSVMDRVSAGAGGGGTQKFHVEKDTVMRAGKVIHEQLGQLETAYKTNVPKLRIPSSDDEITEDIVKAWNDRLVFHDDSYANRITLYMEKLRNLSDQLRESALQYGYTDDEVAAVFSKSKE